MYKYKIIKADLKTILDKFIDIYPQFKDSENHCLIYHNSKLGFVEYNKKIIGSLLYREYNEFPLIWELGHIKILSDYQSKGIGSKLLEQIILDIKKNNGKKIIVHVSESNKVAQEFYKKNKFIKEATIKNMKLGKENLHLYTLG